MAMSHILIIGHLNYLSRRLLIRDTTRLRIHVIVVLIAHNILLLIQTLEGSNQKIIADIKPMMEGTAMPRFVMEYYEIHPSIKISENYCTVTDRSNGERKNVQFRLFWTVEDNEVFDSTTLAESRAKMFRNSGFLTG